MRGVPKRIAAMSVVPWTYSNSRRSRTSRASNFSARAACAGSVCVGPAPPPPLAAACPWCAPMCAPPGVLILLPPPPLMVRLLRRVALSAGSRTPPLPMSPQLISASVPAPALAAWCRRRSALNPPTLPSALMAPAASADPLGAPAIPSPTPPRHPPVPPRPLTSAKSPDANRLIELTSRRSSPVRFRD